jgi:hypothetical protein
MANGSAQDERQYCLECGAEMPPWADRCWCCRRKFGEEEPVLCECVVVEEPSQVQFRFGLASLILAMTLVAVLVGVCTVWPGIGVFVCLFSAPAFLHAVTLARYKRSRGETMSISRKIGFFLVWVGLAATFAVAVAVSSITALLAMCSIVAQGRGEGDMPTYAAIGLMVSVLAGLLAFVFWLAVRSFTRKAK